VGKKVNKVKKISIMHKKQNSQLWMKICLNIVKTWLNLHWELLWLWWFQLHQSVLSGVSSKLDIEPQAVAVSPYSWLMTHYGWLAG